MTTETKAEQLARAWIEGWNAGKPDDIPLSEDFTHSSPLDTVTGREKYLAWVKPLAAKNVVSLTIKKIVGNADEACIWFEMMTPNGLVRCCDWIERRGEEIASVTSFYDASKVSGSSEP